MPLVFIAIFDIRIIAKHIPVATNTSADKLSRNQISQFLITHHKVLRISIPLPSSLLRTYRFIFKVRLDIPALPPVIEGDLNANMQLDSLSLERTQATLTNTVGQYCTPSV